jgi:hypothetical protein
MLKTIKSELEDEEESVNNFEQQDSARINQWGMKIPNFHNPSETVSSAAPSERH